MPTISNYTWAQTEKDGLYLKRDPVLCFCNVAGSSSGRNVEDYFDCKVVIDTLLAFLIPVLCGLFCDSNSRCSQRNSGQEVHGILCLH